MNRIDAIGFDLDGVLINSLPLMEKAWEEVRFKCNVSIPFNRYIEYIGYPFDTIIKELNLFDKYETIRQVYFYATKKYQKLIKIYPGLHEVLNYLNKNNIPLFIITSKPRLRAQEILFSLKIDIHHMVCPEDVIRGKPYSDSADLIRKKLNLEEKKVLFVGDMMVDYEFAANAKFKFCYASYGYGDKHKFNNIECIKIDNLTVILDVFKFS